MERLLKIRDKVLRNAVGKTALLTRYGAIGDLIMITAVLKQLKKDGYYVVVNTHKDSIPLTCNPYIDANIRQNEDEIPNEKLTEYWKELRKGFDRFINLSESIEGSLLKPEGSMTFNWPKDIRHEECNKNYMDYTMKMAGYNIQGALPELFFSKAEHKWVKRFRRKYRDKFLILVSMSGSALHKVYPFMENVITEFLDTYRDTIAVTVGDYACKILEWEHPRTLAWSGRLNLRKSLILTQYADLVIGTETGIMNAASCFDTPKIVMLSHSSKENLTKYWKNCESIHSDVSCYPCHQLHYSKKSCKLNSATNSPICMTQIHPVSVLSRIENFYKESRRQVA
jgi:ADP-heptose:LPS heptosyltransferase